MLIAGLFLGFSLPGAGASAQGEDALRERHRISLLPLLEVPARGSVMAPGISIGSPTAFGADYGDAFVGVGFQARTRRRDEPDGAAGVGFGIGDARRLVGLEVTLTTFGTVETCCRGGVSAKLHRVLGYGTAVAIGVENGGRWRFRAPSGERTTDAGTSGYAVATRVFRLSPTNSFRSASLSVGAGNGRFRTEDDILADRSSINPFVSGSLRFHESASVIADWTGQELLAGFSLVPFRRLPLVITPAVADVTDEPRFIVGAGFGFDYTSLF